MFVSNVRSNPTGEKCLQACAAIAWGYNGSMQIRAESYFLFGVGHWFWDPAHRARAQAQLQHSILEPAKPIQEDIPRISDQSRQWLWRQGQHHFRAANSWGFADDFYCNVYCFQVGRHVWWECTPIRVRSHHSWAIRKTQATIFARAVELHEDIVDDLVQKWGTATVDVHAALHESCNNRGLHFSILNDQSAAEELSRRQGRDLLARFWLSASAWKRFSDFFVEHPLS